LGLVDIIIDPISAMRHNLGFLAQETKLYIRIGFAILYLGDGIFAIVYVEKMITINHIDLSAAKLTDSGQLIPLLAGILGFITVC
jgi:hypothetical protein